MSVGRRNRAPRRQHGEATAERRIGRKARALAVRCARRAPRPARPDSWPARPRPAPARRRCRSCPDPPRAGARAAPAGRRAAWSAAPALVSSERGAAPTRQRLASRQRALHRSTSACTCRCRSRGVSTETVTTTIAAASTTPAPTTTRGGRVSSGISTGKTGSGTDEQEPSRIRDAGEPQSGYQPDDRPMFELYRGEAYDRATGRFGRELCMRVWAR